MDGTSLVQTQTKRKCKYVYKVFEIKIFWDLFIQAFFLCPVILKIPNKRRRPKGGRAFQEIDSAKLLLIFMMTLSSQIQKWQKNPNLHLVLALSIVVILVKFVLVSFFLLRLAAALDLSTNCISPRRGQPRRLLRPYNVGTVHSYSSAGDIIDITCMPCTRLVLG